MLSEPKTTSSILLAQCDFIPLHSRLVQPRMNVCLSPSSHSEAMSSWEEQDASISYSGPNHALLKLNSMAIWSRVGGSLSSPSSHWWDGGSTLGAALLRVPGPQSLLLWLIRQWFHTGWGKLRRLKSNAPSPPSTQLLEQVSLNEMQVTVLSPSSRAVVWIFYQGVEAVHKTDSS